MSSVAQERNTTNTLLLTSPASQCGSAVCGVSVRCVVVRLKASSEVIPKLYSTLVTPPLNCAVQPLCSSHYRRDIGLL